MKSLPKFKIGDTFAFQAIMKNADATTTTPATPITGAVSKLKSQIRNYEGVLFAELTISETATLGTYLFVAEPDVTELFPNTDLYCDIQYTDNDVITSSETIFIPIEKDVTKNE